MPAMAEAIDQLARLIERGGVVMIPLLALSLVSVALILERAWYWARTNRAGRLRRVERLRELLVANDARSEALIASDGSVYGAVARRLRRVRPSEAAAIAAVESQRPRMERFMVTLSTIITAAPLLGILGTVLGIIQSFDLLGQEETLTDPRIVSGGIAEALLTTALGLVIALVTLFPYMLFRGQIDRTLGRLEALVAAAQEGSARDTTETNRTRDRKVSAEKSPVAAAARGDGSE